MQFKSNINKCLKTNLPIIKKDSIYKKSFIKSILFITTDEWKEMQNKSHKLQGLYRKRAEFNTQLEDLDLEKVTIMIDGLSLGDEGDLFNF